jgi:hypothetical protein
LHEVAFDLRGLGAQPSRHCWRVPPGLAKTHPRAAPWHRHLRPRCGDFVQVPTKQVTRSLDRCIKSSLNHGLSDRRGSPCHP